MEFGCESGDLLKLAGGKRSMESITPHKIAVIAFIREFGLLKQEAKDMIMFDCAMSPKYRKDFCMLALKLIQCPDMEFKELETLLTTGRYHLLSVHLQKFCARLQCIYVNGIGALTDCITSTVDKLMAESLETNPCVITRSSVLGFYLRRMMLYLDKLTFVQLAGVYKSFCLYYQKGRPGLMIRSLSKERLDSVDVMTSAAPSSPTLLSEDKHHEYSMKIAIIDRDNNFEECQWSRKQAELFTAQQAKLLHINEPKALPPKQLQKTITQIMNDIPDYPDAHFLSFLNCLRVKEFCGAQDSLYNCFDRKIINSSGGHSAGGGDKNKSFRYAALNRGAMHALFGHRQVATEALVEALVMAQEAGEGVCLAHVVAWLVRWAGRGLRAALLSRAGAASPPAAAAASAAPRAPPAHTAAAAAQLLAQHSAVYGSKPSDVFNLLIRSDALNYLHSMTDLTLANLANMAALWSLYGKTEMASISCQLLLNLNTKSVSGVGAWYWTEAVVDAVGGAAAVGAWRGEAALARAALAHHSAPLAATQAHRAHAAHALHAGKWQEAEQTIQQLASLDRWESQLLKAEMYYLRGEANDAIASLADVLQFCKTEDDSLHFVALKVRAMTLMAQVQNTYSGTHGTSSSNMTLLNEALTLAHKYHLHYLAAVAEMHIANTQLHLGCVTNAFALVKRVLPTIMAHGGAYDMARGMLLYTKCRVAAAPAGGEARADVLASCCDALDSVKKNFTNVDAYGRLKETLYLQAQLYNEIGNYSARNQCAFTYRQLDMQNPMDPTNLLLTSF